MKKFMLIRQPFVVLIMCLLTSCTGMQQNLENKKSEIRSNYAVRERNALDALALARLEDPYLAELEEKSVAQIVFPKAVKAGIILGAKYSEGFIMKDGEAIAEVRMSGGNIGPQIGGQQYSQISYVMTSSLLMSVMSRPTFEIQGSLSYASRGSSKTQIISAQSRIQELHTHIFNQTGYLAGITIDGNVYEVIKRY